MRGSTVRSMKLIRHTAAAASWFVLSLCTAPAALAEEDGYVVYLSEYGSGAYYLAALGDVSLPNSKPLRPTRLDMPRLFSRRAELGNHDVSYDGRLVTFAARVKGNSSWDIYVGRLDLPGARITDVEAVVRTETRDEDPRFSWSSTEGDVRIVYKCDNDICVYDGHSARAAVRSECELWAPSFSPSGTRISYGKRCGEPSSDRIWYYDSSTGLEYQVPNQGGQADRFAYFLYEDTLVYSHIDAAARESSLWRAFIPTSGAANVELWHDRTESDDDPYPDRTNRDLVAFIGWENVGWKRGGGYNLFVYRISEGTSVRLTEGIPVLAPAIFHPR